MITLFQGDNLHNNDDYPFKTHEICPFFICNHFKFHMPGLIKVGKKFLQRLMYNVACKKDLHQFLHFIRNTFRKRPVISIARIATPFLIRGTCTCIFTDKNTEKCRKYI